MVECVLEAAACGTGEGFDGEPLGCAATLVQDTADLALLRLEPFRGEVLRPTEFLIMIHFQVRLRVPFPQDVPAQAELDVLIPFHGD